MGYRSSFSGSRRSAKACCAAAVPPLGERPAPAAARLKGALLAWLLGVGACLIVLSLHPRAAQSGVTGSASVGGSAAAPSADGTGGAQSGGATDQNPFSGLTFSGNNGPINIKSDKLSLDYKNRTVTFRGHVHAAQAGSEVTSDSLTVKYGNDFHDIKEIVADGSVRLSQGTRWATGSHAVLNQDTHTAVLTGSPVIHDGTDQIAGTRITVHLDTGQSEVESARAVIFPKQAQTGDNEASADGRSRRRRAASDGRR